MRLFDELKKVTAVLAAYPGQWAVCGGVAASIYRETPRFTDDIDIALIDIGPVTAKALAIKVIEEIGYKDYMGFVPDPKDLSKQLNALVCARGIDDDRFKGFDFLLPVQSWVPPAVRLAQSNFIDYGFANLPTITPESLVFAKLISLNSNAERYQDFDDIREILKGGGINFSYLWQEITSSDINFKPEVLSLLPKA